MDILLNHAELYESLRRAGTEGTVGES